jgi:hypothetical protein
MFAVTDGNLHSLTNTKPCFCSIATLKNLWRKLRTRYSKWFCILDLANYAIFISMLVLQYKVNLLPEVKAINGEHFPQFFAEANKWRVITRLNSFSNFLNWMKVRQQSLSMPML